MTFSLVQSAAAPFFFGAFRADPAAGVMGVPVPLGSLTNMVHRMDLTPETCAPFAQTLAAAFTEIRDLLAEGGNTLTLSYGDERWTAVAGGPRHILLHDFPGGRGLVFDCGAHLTRSLIGGSTGMAVAVKRLGTFGHVEMAQGFSLKHRMRWIPTAYRMEIRECAVAGLKASLGLPSDVSVFELGARLFRSMDADDLDVLQGENPNLSRIEGRVTEPEAFLEIQTDLEIPYPGLGFVSESLKVVFTPEALDQRLPPALLSLWRLCETSAEDYPTVRSPGAREAQQAYWETTRRLYGDLESLMPS